MAYMVPPRLGLFKLLNPGFECIEKSVIFRIQKDKPEG